MFDGYVLVGGKSSRMQSEKASLRLGGQTFVERAAETLESIARKVSVVVNESQNEFSSLPRVVDVFAERGALGGIHAALSHSRNEWAIILACDYPFVTAELLNRLLIICLNETKAAAIVPVQPDGRIQPLCAFYRVAPCLKVVNTLLAESGKTPPVRSLLDSVETRTIDFAEISDLPHAEFFFENANTPADFIRAQEIYQTFFF